MVDSALLGFGIPGNDNPILPSSPDAYRSDIIQRDVAKAKQLLAEAGHPDGISVDLQTTELYPGAMQMVQAYQEDCRRRALQIAGVRLRALKNESAPIKRGAPISTIIATTQRHALA